MNHLGQSSKKIQILKIVLGGATLVGLGAAKILWDARPRWMSAVEQIDLEKFQGKWFEIARKPVMTERHSFKNISLHYTHDRESHLDLELHYIYQGKLGQFHAEMQIDNPPDNSRFSVAYLPSFLRHLKKAHHWIIKMDADYQMALVGNPNRKYLWLLSRHPHPDLNCVDDYLNYAKKSGYKLDDLIMVEHD